MRREHIIKLLVSALEGNGIVSVIFNFFHNKWKYSIDKLYEIILFWVKNGGLLIENVNYINTHHDTINW